MTMEIEAAESFRGTTGVFQRFVGEQSYSDELIQQGFMVIGGATIYWSEKYGAYATLGPIAEWYERSGGTWGDLGFPTSELTAISQHQPRPDERQEIEDIGAYQRFEGGVLYWSADTGVVQTDFAVDAYLEMLHGIQTVGFPVRSPRSCVSSHGTRGYVQTFTGGDASYLNPAVRSPISKPANVLLCWSERYGPHVIDPRLTDRYLEFDGPSGELGFPTTSTWSSTDEILQWLPDLDAADLTTYVQRFERGWLCLPIGVDDAVPPMVPYQPFRLYPMSNPDSYQWTSRLDEVPSLSVIEDADRRPELHRTDASPQGAEGFIRYLDHGAMLLCARYGPIPIWYDMYAYFQGHGGVTSHLGFPTTSELEAITSPFGTTGTYQRFEGRWIYDHDVLEKLQGVRCGATIYWSARWGTYVTTGGIGGAYEEYGGTSGDLGFPTGDEHQVVSPLGTTGYLQRFEGGWISWSETTGSLRCWGAIGDCFDQHGGVETRLGFPVTSDREAIRSRYGTTGSYQRFEADWTFRDDVLEKLQGVRCGATIYWCDRFGAYVVRGAIGQFYEDHGGTSSTFGFPTTDEMDNPQELISILSDPGDRRLVGQRFEGGWIYWDADHDQVLTLEDV